MQCLKMYSWVLLTFTAQDECRYQKKRHPLLLLFLSTFRCRGGVQPELPYTFPCRWFASQHQSTWLSSPPILQPII